MRGRDATCECYGSLLHQLFDASPTKPHRYVARLFIRTGGLGNDATPGLREIHEELARFILEEMGKNPFCKRGSKRAKLLENEEHENCEHVLRVGLRRHAEVLAHRAEVACPKKLRPVAQEAVQAAITRAHNEHRGTVGALPIFKEDVRTTRKNRAASVLATTMQAWLESDAAKEWREERKALFAPDA